MKNIFARIAIIVFLANFSFVQAQELNDVFETIVKSEKRANEGKFLRKGSVNTENYDIKHHSCTWKINPFVSYIEGNVATTFKVTEASDKFFVDLHQVFQVDSILFNGKIVSFSRPNNQIEISLDEILNVGDLASMVIFYRGTPPSTGFGSFVQTEHAGVPVLWTLSEPFGASDWWPCKNSLTDKADSVDIYIETPNGYRAASNGLLMSEINNTDSTVLYHWKHRYPIATYLVALAVTNYATFSQKVPLGSDTLEVLNYVYPESYDEALFNTQEIIPQIILYSELFGVYPFVNEKYGHAQFSWGGGMEHQTMSFMVNFGYELMAHELAHQWFGDKITCGSWEDIWLNEGFATYLSGLCYERLKSPENWRNFKAGRISSITSKAGGSLKCSDTTSVSRIFDGRLTYNKGAMVLHQLRWLLGDDDFFAAIRNYLNDPELAYSFAKTPDLKRHLEEQSGLNLDEYFKDWYEGEGFPSYLTVWNQNEENFSLVLSQTTSSPVVDFFEMKVPFLLSGEGKDTIVVVDHTENNQTFNFSIPFKVNTVVLDPDLWLISNGNVTTILRENYAQKLMLYPNPATDKVNIQLPAGNFPSEIKITNGVGQVVWNKKVVQSGLYELDLNRFSSGTYIVSVQNEDKIYLNMLVLQ